MNVHVKSSVSRYDKTRVAHRIKLTPNRLDRLMAFFVHGYLSTSMLHALVDSRISIDYCSEELKFLKRAPNSYIEQSDELKNRFQALSSELYYRINDHGVDALLRHGRITLEDAELWHKLHSRPRPGQFWHDLATSFTSASFELGCKNLGYEFISVYDIIRAAPQKTKDLAVPTSIPSDNTHSIPDALFGYRDGKTENYFAVETDFGTEQGKESDKKFSTVSAKYKSYRHIWRQKTYEAQFGIPNLKLLFTFLSPLRTRNKKRDFKEMAQKDPDGTGSGGPVYFRCLPELDRQENMPLPPTGTMLLDTWERMNAEPRYLYERKTA